MSYSRAIDRMMASVRPRLPGVLDPAIQNELFIVMDEFFKGSLAWKNVVPISVVAGTQGYDLEPDDNGIVWELMLSYQQLNPATGQSAWDTTGSVPVPARMDVPGTVYFMNPVNEAGTVQVQVALTVDQPLTSDGFPIAPLWLCDRYAQSVWLDGVLGKMMSQPAKPYSNAQLSLFHLRRFRSGIMKAKVTAQHANVYRGQAWKFPQQIAVKHQR